MIYWLVESVTNHPRAVYMAMYLLQAYEKLADWPAKVNKLNGVPEIQPLLRETCEAIRSFLKKKDEVSPHKRAFDKCQQTEGEAFMDFYERFLIVVQHFRSCLADKIASDGILIFPWFIFKDVFEDKKLLQEMFPVRQDLGDITHNFATDFGKTDDHYVPSSDPSRTSFITPRGTRKQFASLPRSERPSRGRNEADDEKVGEDEGEDIDPPFLETLNSDVFRRRPEEQYQRQLVSREDVKN